MVVITGTMIAGGLMAGASIYQARVAASTARKAAQSARERTAALRTSSEQQLAQMQADAAQ